MKHRMGRKVLSWLLTLTVTMVAGLLPGTGATVYAETAIPSNGSDAGEGLEYYVGFTATSSSGAVDQHGTNAGDMFDGNGNNKLCWRIDNNTFAVEFHSPSSFAPKKYYLRTGEDTATYRERNPRTWKIYAKETSSDTNWTEIASETNNDTMQAANHTAYEFSFNSGDTAYRYFRLEVTDVFATDSRSDHNGQKYIQLSELYMTGKGTTVACVTSGGTTTEYTNFGAALDAWGDGTTLKLLADMETTSTISMSSGTKTLELNGHSITMTGDPGSVFQVTGGNLTVNGTGTISGGKGFPDGWNRQGGGFYVVGNAKVAVNNVMVAQNQAYYGGGVFVRGPATFIMNDGVISQNRTNNYNGWTSGGGVWVEENGTFIMNGGSVTGNTAANPGDNGRCGVDVNSGVFKVSGDAKIIDNLKNGSQINFSGTVTVDGPLADGASIGVTHGAGVFTNSADTAYNDLSKFTSDNSAYAVGKNADGQLFLGTPVTVTYKVVNGTWAEGGTGDKTEVVASGSTPGSAPTGMVAAEGYTGGAWDTDPTGVPITGDTTFTYTFEAEQPAVPSLKKLSLTLSGTIGANYLMDLSMLDEATQEASHMEFTVGIGAKQVSFDVPFNKKNKSNDGTLYGFTCPTTSIQMADPIRATYCYGEGERIDLDVHTVEEYVGKIVSDPGTYGDKAVALVKAIADYGHYAQIFLKAANGWAFGSDYTEMVTHYAEYSDSDLADIKSALGGFAPVKSYGGTKVGSASLRLHLDSGTSIEALLKPAEGESFTPDDANLVTAEFEGASPKVELLSDGRISVRVDGVSAHLLGSEVSVKFNGEEVLRFSALTYAKVEIGSGREGAKDAMCSLYNYYQKTMGYRPQQS